MIRVITQQMIEGWIVQAAQSPRKRMIYRLHEHEEPVQRMVNALPPGTYTPPHKHENPDKVELFSILIGKIAILQFDDRGTVQQVYLLDANGPVRVVDIAPGTYHAIVALEPSAALEIIQGPYNAQTHKQFAPWAPAENTEGVTAYLRQMETIVQHYLKEQADHALSSE
jgi:cupin fold WbuC family metalloprotein